MDKITWYEVKILLGDIDKAERTSWKQTQLTMWSVIQAQSNKKIKPEDVLHLPWEEKDDRPKVTQEEIEAFKKRKNISN